MSTDPTEGIIRQFSEEGSHADIWRLLDLVVETDGYLNLGYSSWPQLHPVGSPQLRLAYELADVLVEHAGRLSGTQLLDLGCGRGGPAVRIADRHRCSVVGVDLVVRNVERAAALAAERNASAAFVCGDARSLPISTAAVDAALAVDSLMYIPDLERAVSEVRRAIGDGWFVASTLVRPADTTEPEREIVNAFARAWDMAPIRTLPMVRRAYERGGIEIRHIEDISANSIRRFRPWTALSVGLFDRTGGAIRWALRYGHLDATAIEDQIRATHEALPRLQHLLIEGRC